MRLTALTAIVLSSLVAACGGDAPANGDANPGGDGHTADGEICVNTAGPALPAPAVVLGTSTTVTKIATLVGGASATLLTAPRNDGRQFVVEQAGRIWVIQDGALKTTPFFDLRNLMVGGETLLSDAPNERGLLGLAFHPDYACNGQFFVFYTTSTSDRVVRFNVDPTDNTKADPTSGTLILSIPDPFENHNGGMIEFGNTDGLLYIATGDGGSANDPRLNGQAILRTDPTCVANQCEPLLAKILRIDVDHPANGKPYGIPAQNPYAGGGGEPEILIRGLRNPWRWSFDRMTGDMYIGDVGQGLYEEIDVIPAAQINGAPGAPINMGWSIMEGLHTFLPSGSNCNGNGTCSSAGLTAPVVEKSHGDGYAAIIGGQVYRGQNYPGLIGNYYFTDYSASTLVQGVYNALGPSMTLVDVAGTTYNSAASLHADAAGELYITDTHGNIWRLEGGP